MLPQKIKLSAIICMETYKLLQIVVNDESLKIDL